MTSVAIVGFVWKKCFSGLRLRPRRVYWSANRPGAGASTLFGKGGERAGFNGHPQPQKDFGKFLQVAEQIQSLRRQSRTCRRFFIVHQVYSNREKVRDVKTLLLGWIFVTVVTVRWSAKVLLVHPVRKTGIADTAKTTAWRWV